MENENTNIALILKERERSDFKGRLIYLFNSLFGECMLKSVTDGCVEVKFADGPYRVERTLCVDHTGRYSPKGDPILFPSSEMRDWNKFAWTEGTLLKGWFWVGNEYHELERVRGYCFFEDFLDDTYTEVEAHAYVPFGRGLEKQDLEDLKTNDLEEVTDGDELFSAFLSMQGYPISKQINSEVFKSGKYDKVLRKVLEEISFRNEQKKVLFRNSNNSINKESSSESLENLVSSKTLIESKELGEEEKEEFK